MHRHSLGQSCMIRPQRSSPGGCNANCQQVSGAGHASNLDNRKWVGLTTVSTILLLTMLLANGADFTVLFSHPERVSCTRLYLLLQKYFASWITLEMIVSIGLIESLIHCIHDMFCLVKSLNSYVFKHCGRSESWHNKSTSITTYLKAKKKKAKSLQTRKCLEDIHFFLYMRAKFRMNGLAFLFP